MLEANRSYSDPEIEDREALWRAMLWDGAPSHLVGTLARSRHTRLSDLTPGVVAALASSGALPRIEDALELSRLAFHDEARRRALQALRDAREVEGAATAPRFVVSAEPGLVLFRLRPDLRAVDHFGLTPEDVRLLLVRLRAAAGEADEMARRRS